MARQDWRSLIDRDTPNPGSFTKKIAKELAGASFHSRGSTRMSMGLIATQEEINKRREAACKRKLP